MDEAFLLQLKEGSCSQLLILMRNFNHLDVCWESNTMGSKQSRGLLYCIEDNFLIQVLGKLTRGEMLLDVPQPAAMGGTIPGLKPKLRRGQKLSCGWVGDL